MDTFLEIVSGEFILRFMPNGGKAILLRTIFVSALLYLMSIGLKSYVGESAILSFSLVQFQKEVAETIPWLGAILGGTYAALYSRFASQWSYLADLYNQQMSAALTLTEEEMSAGSYVNWQAAFVEDAVCMHLHMKAGFSNLVLDLLQDPKIKNVLIDQEHFGVKKYEKVLSQLKSAVRAV